MKRKDTYKVTTDDGKIVCGKVEVVEFNAFIINDERFLFCDMESIEKIKPYTKKTTIRPSIIGVPR